MAVVACASVPDPLPPDEQLYFVRTERNQFMWSDWDFYLRNKKSWYVDGTFTGVPLGQPLQIQGDWYDPEKSARRETFSVIASTGLIFPPNYLFLGGLRPDLRCTATLDYPFRSTKKYSVRLDSVGTESPVMLALYEAEHGDPLTRVACHKR
jgi:hypothetical protein